MCFLSSRRVASLIHADLSMRVCTQQDKVNPLLVLSGGCERCEDTWGWREGSRAANTGARRDLVSRPRKVLVCFGRVEWKNSGVEWDRESRIQWGGPERWSSWMGAKKLTARRKVQQQCLLKDRRSSPQIVLRLCSWHKIKAADLQSWGRFKI